MHTDHSNQIKPLNVEDQSQEAGGLRLAVSRVRWVTLRLPLHFQDRTGVSGPCTALTAGTEGPFWDVLRPAPAGRSEWSGVRRTPARPRIPRPPGRPPGASRERSAPAGHAG